MYTRKPPPWAIQLSTQVARIQKGINEIMALVSIDQAELDNLAAALEGVKTALSTEIDSLKTQLPAADLSGLNKALTDLQGLEAPAPPA